MRVMIGFRVNAVVMIFIDLDNTLILRKKNVPHLSKIADDLHRMLQILDGYALPPTLLHELAQTKRLALFWNAVMSYLYSSPLHPTEITAIRQALHDVILKHECMDHEYCYLPEETLPFLNQLHAAMHRLILLTNTSRQELNKIFQRYPLATYFSDSITRDDVTKMKPDPEGVIQLLNRYHEHTFIVIDDLDYGMLVTQKAQKAGYRGYAILVNRGRYQEDDVQKLMPDYAVTSLAEIPPLIHQIVHD
jgi:phosphoglycolate phosphatase-like HAD superfamily hydrolase